MRRSTPLLPLLLSLSLSYTHRQVIFYMHSNPLPTGAQGRSILCAASANHNTPQRCVMRCFCPGVTTRSTRRFLLHLRRNQSDTLRGSGGGRGRLRVTPPRRPPEPHSGLSSVVCVGWRTPDARPAYLYTRPRHQHNTTQKPCDVDGRRRVEGITGATSCLLHS